MVSCIITNMYDTKVSLIAALSEQTRAIGKDNKLLWHLEGDLRRFKELTMGHPIIMGSTTYESIGKPLPGRTNIVLTQDKDYAPEGVTVCYSVEEALGTARAQNEEEVFVIGGGMVYTQTIQHADKLYLTLVDDAADGDTFFPDYQSLGFEEVASEQHNEHSPPFRYALLERAH